MDDFDTEGASYVLIRLDEGHEPQQYIGKLEELLEEYDFHRKLIFANDSSNPCMIYSNDVNGCIMVSYGCNGISINSKPIQSTKLANEADNSIFIRKICGDDYLFDRIISDLNDGEDYEIEETNMENMDGD